MSKTSKQPCVLFVDDDKALLELMEINLGSDYDVVLAEGGVAGLAKLKICIPDVMVLDLAMPDMDGFSVLQKMQADTRTRNIPVIILTARESNENQDKCLKLGAKGFLVKPFEFEDLAKKINSFLLA